MLFSVRQHGLWSVRVFNDDEFIDEWQQCLHKYPISKEPTANVHANSSSLHPGKDGDVHGFD